VDLSSDRRHLRHAALIRRGNGGVSLASEAGLVEDSPVGRDGWGSAAAGADAPVASVRTAAEAARRLRHTLPLVVIVEPRVSGMREEPAAFSRDVSLLLISMLVRSSRVTVGGLLVLERIDAAGESATSMAGRLGYEYAVESEIRIEGRRYEVRMVISGMNPAVRVLEATTAVDPWDPDSLADDVAAWMSQRIDAVFAPQD
jgi:hypothetical protein